jgi:hypothetical protein
MRSCWSGFATTFPVIHNSNLAGLAHCPSRCSTRTIKLFVSHTIQLGRVRRGRIVPIIALHNVVSYTVRQGYGGPKVVSDEDILEDASPFSFRYASQSVRDI